MNWRGGAIGACVGAVALLSLLASACGTADDTQQQLDKAVEQYDAALREVEQLDLRDSARSEVEAAEQRLQAAWEQVERRAGEAGHEVSAGLSQAHDEVTRALKAARAGAEEGAQAARTAVETALDSLRSGFDRVLQDIEDLF